MELIHTNTLYRDLRSCLQYVIPTESFSMNFRRFSFQRQHECYCRQAKPITGNAVRHWKSMPRTEKRRLNHFSKTIRSPAHHF